jgi:hypothetical protein
VTFTASITSTPNGYTSCSISPQSTTANPGQTVTFTVSCSGGSSPPPGGGNEYAYVYTDISAPSNVSWTVYLYFDGQLDATYQGSGSQSYGPAVFSSSGTVSYEVSGIPSTCSVSYSPSQSFSISPGNSYTETITITCQGQQPPPPPTTYGCFLTVSGQSNPQGVANVNVNPSGKVFVPSGQTQTIKATAPLSSGGGNSWYEFTGWSDSFSGSGTLSGPIPSTRSNAQSTWQYECPSGLTSNVTATATIIANYVHDYITLSGPTTISEGTTSAQYTLTWNVAPGSADNVQWSASVVQVTNPAQYEVSATLTYTEYGAQSKGGSQLTVTLTCNHGEAVLQNVSITSQSPTGNSDTATVYIEWYCQVSRGNGQ